MPSTILSYSIVADSAETTGLKWAAPAGGGKVLQVVQATYSTETNIASTSMTDTGLSVTITPSLTTSKVLILVSQSLGFYRDDAQQAGGGWRLMRGATEIFDGYADYAMGHGITVNGVPTFIYYYAPLNYLDSPATTSATTYTTQARVTATSFGGKATAQVASNTSSIIAMEIGV